MDIFNGPTRETCTVRRERTDTPLQALVTMNDPQFVEAARFLSQQALSDNGGDIDRQFDWIATRLLARRFDSREREIAKRSYHDYLAYYEAHEGEAQNLLKVGESAVNKTLAGPRLAALTMVTNQVMNLDEVLNK